MTAKGKDTVYIDVDEEITSIISKISNSPKDIVALVLPKRASAMQSIVNMKLLKRTADQNSKQVVLITSEPRLIPLAGIAKLHVAPNLTSKPYMPKEPTASSASDKPVEVSGGEVDPGTPVSLLAPDAKFADDQEPIPIDNTAKPTAPIPPNKPKAGKGNKFKIPNFTKFRKKMIFGGLAALLVIGLLIYGLIFAPKAKVLVKAETSETALSLPFIADTAATELDKDSNIVQALTKEAQKNDSEKVETSGEENKGDKASGEVSMTVKKCTPPLDEPPAVPSGTGISANNQTYITQEKASFAFAGASGSCVNYKSPNPIPIVSQKGGKANNVPSGTNFSVAGRSDVAASGSASGGTDKIVRVVSLTDIDKAKERINSKQNTVQEDMKTEFARQGYVPINESFSSTDADYVVSTAIGAEANEVSVSVTIKYAMLGVKEDDIKALIEEQIKEDDQNGGQKVLNDGLAQAKFTPSEPQKKLSDKQKAFTLESKVVLGPEIKQDEIKQQISGKKTGEAEDLIKDRAGLADPKIELSPFWVRKIPKASRITIEVQQADGTNIPQQQ